MVFSYRTKTKVTKLIMLVVTRNLNRSGRDSNLQRSKCSYEETLCRLSAGRSVLIGPRYQLARLFFARPIWTSCSAAARWCSMSTSRNSSWHPSHIGWPTIFLSISPHETKEAIAWSLKLLGLKTAWCSQRGQLLVFTMMTPSPPWCSRETRKNIDIAGYCLPKW